HAARYYDSDLRNPLRARAYYYKGIVEANDSDYSQALLSQKFAEETASAIGDTLRLALIHRSMADVFDHINSKNGAIRYYHKSYDEFQSIKDPIYTTYAKYDMARIYYNAGKYDTAAIHAKEAVDISAAENKEDLYISSARMLGMSYESSGQYSKAKECLISLHKTYPEAFDESAWNSLGISYLSTGDITKARACEDSLRIKCDTTMWLSYLLALHDKDSDKALRLLQKDYDECGEIYVDWVSRRSDESLFEQYGLLKDKTRIEKRQQKLTMALIVAVIVIIALLIILIVGYVNSRLKSRNGVLVREKRQLLEDNNQLSSEKTHLMGVRDQLTLENTRLSVDKEKITIEKVKLLTDKEHLEKDVMQLEEKIAQLDYEMKTKDAKVKELNEGVIEKKNIIDSLNIKMKNEKLKLEKQINITYELKSLLSEYLTSRYEVFDRLTKVYYDKEGNYQNNKDVYEALQTMIINVREDKSILRQMEDVANRAKDNIISDFKRDYPGLNNWEYNLYLFLIIGFSPKSISIFQDVPIERIYNRKKSLIGKIKLKADIGDRYLEAL
ncbi:MAG: tetratricopeptide repeat protein, partial [Muribaculum sp.]|nr:tetratricopeptide repeat protein [Muribaculum sp.]